MNTEQLALFDYNQLVPQIANEVQQRTSNIRGAVQRSAKDIIVIGTELKEVKRILPHGLFGRWLDNEFGWSQQTAKRFMNVSDSFQNQQFVDFEFAPSALYLLAAPSTPDEARQEALERAENGEPITYKAAKEIVDNHKPKTLDDIYRETSERQNQPDGAMTKVKREWETLNSSLPYEPTKNYKRDNRRATPQDIYTPQGLDACQTPPYALDPLLPYLKKEWTIWEPAAGEGYLAEAFYDAGFDGDQVCTGDILTGQNFFEYEPPQWDCLVTNPPYSIQRQWLERCYQLGKPFALLIKVEALGTQGTQELIETYGFEMMLLDKRVDFKMPIKGWDGNAQFPTFWLCWKLLSEHTVFGKLDKTMEF